MSEYARFEPVVDAVEMALTEIRQLVEEGPCFRLVYKSDCPGEEAAWTLLVYRSQEYLLSLSRSCTVVFNYLAQTRLPQSAKQISEGIGRRRRLRVRSVKVYIQRLRKIIQLALTEARLNLEASAVLSSERTESNEVRYRLKGTIERLYLNRLDGK